MSQAMMLSCRSCERTIQGAALACVACGAIHHEGCYGAAGHCAACTCAKPAVPVSVMGRERARTGVLLAAALAMLALVGAVMLQGHWTQPGPRPVGLKAAPVEVLDSNRVNVTGRWRGNISGNDPRVSAEVALHQSGAEVSGVLFWSSPNSGRSERRVRGHFDRERRMLMLKDVEMPVAQANGAWHFCPVDYYLLELSGDDLSGSYWSAACSDRARVKLRRLY